MREPLRLCRSVLFVPASKERALAKATTTAADAVIVDLEDAVAPSAKVEARERASVAANRHPGGRQKLVIRINGLDTPWHAADLAAVARLPIAAIVMPKVDSAKSIHTVEQELRAAGAPESLRLWAMIETPCGVLHAAEIAAASPRLELLVLGINDLASGLRAELVPGRQPLLVALSLCVAAARSAGKLVLDGVYNEIVDGEGFAAECRQARAFGCDGKTLIHPSQVETCNRIFSPTAAEREQAQRIVDAYQRALADGQGVVALDGRMIEELHAVNAQRILDLAAALGAE